MTDARDIVEVIRQRAETSVLQDGITRLPSEDFNTLISTIASLRKQLEDARGALRQWQEWETKWLVDARCWVTDDGSHIPQDLFDEYVCGPQNAREALKGKS